MGVRPGSTCREINAMHAKVVSMGMSGVSEGAAVVTRTAAIAPQGKAASGSHREFVQPAFPSTISCTRSVRTPVTYVVGGPCSTPPRFTATVCRAMPAADPESKRQTNPRVCGPNHHNRATITWHPAAAVSAAWTGLPCGERVSRNPMKRAMVKPVIAEKASIKTVPHVGCSNIAANTALPVMFAVKIPPNIEKAKAAAAPAQNASSGRTTLLRLREGLALAGSRGRRSAASGGFPAFDRITR